MTAAEAAYQRMLICCPGDSFHEMFSFVVRVRSLAHNKVAVTEHSGTGPTRKKIIFNSKKDFADHYAYKSKAMRDKSTLHWAQKGFKLHEELDCICDPKDLFSSGCLCV